MHPDTNETLLESASEPPIVINIISKLYAVFLILIFTFGLFGNALTVIVLRTKHLRQSSTAVYLTTLAVVDIFYLSTSMLAQIINYTILFPSDVRNLSVWTCRIYSFINYTVAYISVWLMVAVTVDRAIWVSLPFRAKIICTKRNAYIVIVSIFLLMTAIDSHLFFTLFMSVDQEQYSECRGNAFIRYVFPYIDMLLIFMLPSFIMLMANLMIGWKLKKVRDFSRQRQVHFRQDVNARQSVVIDDLSRRRSNRPNVKSEQSESNEGGLKKSAVLTAMLVSISVFFMVSVLPLMIYDVVYFAADLSSWIKDGPPSRESMIMAIERSAYAIWYTNFAVHFILYCLNGPPFRGEVIRLLRSMIPHRFQRQDSQHVSQSTVTPHMGNGANRTIIVSIDT